VTTCQCLLHDYGLRWFTTWRPRSHVLAPLITLASPTKKWVCGTNDAKLLMKQRKHYEKNVILAFPDFTRDFIIYTDASKYQRGGVITQETKPLPEFNDAQTRYTTTYCERESLSIVETLSVGSAIRGIPVGFHRAPVFPRCIIGFAKNPHSRLSPPTMRRAISWKESCVPAHYQSLFFLFKLISRQ